MPDTATQVEGSMRAVVVGLAMLSSAGAASAQSGDDLIPIYMTGPTLADQCRCYLTAARSQWKVSGQVAFDAGLCRGFVTGVADAIAFEGITGRREHSVAVCVPRGLETTVLTEVVANFADRRPEKRVQSAYAMVREALADAYPCR